MTKRHVRVAGKFIPHKMLLIAAVQSLKSADTKTIGQFWDYLGTILYCSLSIEAIGNSYGETFITRWKDFESASPIAKIRLVAERCGLKPDFSKDPWSKVNELIKFRNLIAHAKMEELLVDGVYPEEEAQMVLYTPPKSKLEAKVTEKFARKSYECIYEVLRLFATGLPIEELYDIEFVSWSGSSSPA